MARKRKTSKKEEVKKNDTKKVKAVDMDKKLKEIKPATGLTPYQIYIREQIAKAGK